MARCAWVAVLLPIDNLLIFSFLGDDKRIKVWDLRSSTVMGEFKGHSDTVLSLDWSPNGDYLASCGMDNTARLWPMRNIAK